MGAPALGGRRSGCSLESGSAKRGRNLGLPPGTSFALSARRGDGPQVGLCRSSTKGKYVVERSSGPHRKRAQPREGCPCARTQGSRSAPRGPVRAPAGAAPTWGTCRSRGSRARVRVASNHPASCGAPLRRGSPRARGRANVIADVRVRHPRGSAARTGPRRARSHRQPGRHQSCLVDRLAAARHARPYQRSDADRSARI